ncbi:MAG: phosphatase PAP2 family protein [Phycisphaeraceae bacterium]|nr:MAG: phosphatase PAP2 family protein [Phycisphaeraceae bacterium]
MPIDRSRMLRDYNRGLAPPVRAAHRMLAPVSRIISPLWAWSGLPHTRAWARPLIITALATSCLLPFDGIIARASRDAAIGGDFRRVLGWFGEYGQGGMIILTAALVFLLDKHNARRLLDYALALMLAAAATLPLKMLTGRPRPRESMLETYTHLDFLGPFGAHPFSPEVGVRHAWEFWSDTNAALWSMPSSHVVYAVVMSVWLAALYPPLRTLAWILAALVAIARVLFGAHYPTDVIVGAALGYLIATPCITRLWGIRLLDWIWQMVVDPDAPPAAPRFEQHRSRPADSPHTPPAASPSR